MNSTTATSKSAKPPTTPPPPRLVAPAAGAPSIEFDSSAVDVLTGRIGEIQALASCVTCLAAIEKSAEGNFAGFILTDNALPLLADVIQRLAEEAGAAGDRLWEQYQQARAAANEERLS